MDEMTRRRQVTEAATRNEVLAFWHDHGAQWAKEVAIREDREHIARIAESIKGKADEQAVATVVSELQAIWKAGFPTGKDGFGWNEMNDRLPEAALLAFVRGVGRA